MPHVTPNATKKDKLDEVKAHINRYPRIESHYCRQSTKFEYLETGLSTSEMYRAYSSTTINPVSMNIYRKVFNGMKPPLKFHKPIKDQCDKCMAFEYKQKAGIVTEDDALKMSAHPERKNVAREQQKIDKLNKDITVCTFDLQQVLTVPKLKVGQAYFLRKMNNMNLTIYDMSSDQGYCYLWDENNGRKGANEVFTGLLQWLKGVAQNKDTDYGVTALEHRTEISLCVLES